MSIPSYFEYAHFISFNSVFADREATADGLNPLTISARANPNPNGFKTRPKLG
jgi:hypothetical protein